MADRHLVVFKAQGHIPGARAGHGGHAGVTKPSEINIPQPAHIAAVGIFVVDDDHRVVAGRRERGERQAEPHRILDQQQFDRRAADADGFAAAERRGHAGQRCDQTVVRSDALRSVGGDRTHDGGSGGRVEQVIDAFEFHGCGDVVAVDPVRGFVVAYMGECRIGIKTVRIVDNSGSGLRAGGLHIGIVHVIIGWEIAAQRLGQAEIPHLHARLHLVGKPRDTRIFTIEHHSPGGRARHVGEQAGGVVDFAEAVKLVPHHVQQQGVAGTDLTDEMHGVRLIKLQHRDIRVQMPEGAHLSEQGGDHTAREIRAGRVREHAQPHIGKHGGDHAGRGGFAVRAGHQHHPVRQRTQGAGEEARVDALNHFAGQRAAAMVQQTRRVPDCPADCRCRERVPRALGLCQRFGCGSRPGGQGVLLDGPGGRGGILMTARYRGKLLHHVIPPAVAGNPAAYP